MYWRFFQVKSLAPKNDSPPSPSPFSPPEIDPPPPPSPSSPPNQPTSLCSRPTVRKIFTGRRISSTLSGIRPCFATSPRPRTPGECCAACEAEPSCVAFTFLDVGGLDCRREEGSMDSGACYLMDSYTGSYDPLEEAFGYHSSNAFLTRGKHRG